MKKVYITITGCNYKYGIKFLKPGMEIILKKDPKNKYDSEAIKATMPGLKGVGYVANSVQTVLGESMSAGRLYDKIYDSARATVLYAFHDSFMAEVNPDDLTWEALDLLSEEEGEGANHDGTINL